MSVRRSVWMHIPRVEGLWEGPVARDPADLGVYADYMSHNKQWD